MLLPAVSPRAVAPPAADSGPGEAALRVRAIVERDYTLVWRFLRRLGVSEFQVDDAAQLVFARVLGRSEVVESGSERAYLMKAALHVSFEYRRARRRTEERRADVELDELTGTAPAPDEALDRRRDRELLDRALERLPTELRAAFTLFELEGLSFTEIAEALDIPRGTVASRIRRARELFSEAVHRLHRGERR